MPRFSFNRAMSNAQLLQDFANADASQKLEMKAHRQELMSRAYKSMVEKVGVLDSNDPQAAVHLRQALEFHDAEFPGIDFMKSADKTGLLANPGPYIKLWNRQRGKQVKTEDDRTNIQIEFDRYKKVNPEYEGDLIQFEGDRAKAKRAPAGQAGVSDLRHAFNTYEQAENSEGRKPLSLAKFKQSFWDKPPRATRTQAQEDSQFQRLRNAMARAYGWSEFSELDEATAKKVLESTTKARSYYSGGMNLDESVKKGYDEIQERYRLETAFPRANTGTWNNKKETKVTVKQLRNSGTSIEKIEELLADAGWNKSDINSIITEAGFTPTSVLNPRFRALGVKPGRVVEATGVDKKTGRKVVKYSDGTIEYASE